ncbi:protease modulator HflC [Chryseomicrobium sp. FSL W7-1435]|uniref:protease modulator HflC n=1 Tax=Chryseomicrobium sp. FSL W7-1435 TaxID=2921704 RepID=UPI00315A252A
MTEKDTKFVSLEERFALNKKKKTAKPASDFKVDWKKHGKLVGGFLFIFILLVILLTNVYVVREGEFKIVRQFGEIVKVVDEPGLGVTIPFIQSTTTVPKYLMNYEISEAEINTLDKRRIIIDNYAVWKVNNPQLMIANAGTLINAESRMEEFIYSVVRTELGRLAYAEIINDEDTSRGSLGEQVTARVNELLTADNYGIEVLDVRIKRTDLPVENEQAVYQDMISEREKIAQKFLSEGDADKRRIEAETDRQVREIIANAEREAAVIISEGEAEAARIYNESFSKDPEFYNLFRTLESYKATIGEDTVIILPSDSPYAQFLSGITP